MPKLLPLPGLLVYSLMWIASTSWASASLGVPVGVVIGPQADDLERYAADQLCNYLDRLHGLKIRPSSELAESADVGLLVGSPQSNPAVRKALGDKDWPQVTDQGIVLKRARLDRKPVLVVGGGSPRATLWAVYELAERWGVRFLLHGDVFPDRAGPFQLPDSDTALEPALPVRQWRVMNALACGPESWGMADYRPVIDQLAKLKFNRLLVYVWSWQPFVHYEAGGIQRRSATLFFGFDLPITQDMPGRHLFGQESRFWNPDLPQQASYEDLSAAGRRLIHNLMDHAHRRGMQCVISADPGEFPPEFAPLITGAQKIHQLGDLSVVPGSGTEMSDPALSDLATAVVRATINTYPESDFLALGVQEHRQWLDQYERAWKELDAKYGIEKVRPLAQILAAAGRRSDDPYWAARSVREVKGDIVTLRFYDHLLSDRKILQNTRRPDVRLIYNCFAEELGVVLPRVMPPGSETLNFVDYTPSRILGRKQILKEMGGRGLPSTLIYTLHDDNVGLLPQLATGSLHALTGELRRDGWAGFSTRYWLIGDHDPCVSYLARAAWDEAATPAAIYRDLISSVCGEYCLNDMLTVFSEVEAATLIMEKNILSVAFPVPGMIMNQWKPAAMPEELNKVRSAYQRALEAARRAVTRATPAGRPYVQYWVGRLEFGIGYLNTVESMRRAATAESQGKPAEAVRHVEAALAQARTAVEAYAGIARDQSDRGAVATMGEFVYRPLNAKVSRLKEKLSESPP